MRPNSSHTLFSLNHSPVPTVCLHHVGRWYWLVQPSRANSPLLQRCKCVSHFSSVGWLPNLFLVLQFVGDESVS
ncbi:Uncharacterised protein [Vibrio cholerae]|nr:Uncharacterised protein [Vibrio cholerae]CSC98100.1 Uncharacterised protein [Vibrio cholerae]